MMMAKRAILILFLSVPLGLVARQTSSAPRLILVLSLDQMRFDYLTRFSPLFKGGFRRLLDEGAVFSEARYRHSNNETGPGHSVILSGRHASSSGIVANAWYDQLLQKVVNVVDDPAQSPVGGKGRAASPVNFLGFMVGDMLKQASPRSKVVGISLKDRSAILMAGRRGDAAYWYETSGGNFITSTYYMAAAAAWLDRWNSRRYVDRFAGKKWDRLVQSPSVYEKYAGPDRIEGEWDRVDTVFPHAIRGKPPEVRFYDDFRRTPFADEMTLEAAYEAMEAHDLGTDEFTDILAIGLSATDVIGHTYGADSQEVLDHLLRLDRYLNELFVKAHRRAGEEGTLVILTADHGSLPLVEVLQARGIPARRVHPKVLDDPVRKALAARFPGVDGIVALVDPPHYYLNERVLRERKIRIGDVEPIIMDALRGTGLVDAVYTRADLLAEGPKGDPYHELLRNSFFLPRSPHVIAVVRKHVYVDERPGGTGHGTLHDYDRHVPIVFMGKGIRSGTYREACGPEDIAPTLAKILGLNYPMEHDSRLLLEMLK
jgi:predicted AlkP superfamily pyrophosphatase or phosphodiesterase